MPWPRTYHVGNLVACPPEPPSHRASLRRAVQPHSSLWQRRRSGSRCERYARSAAWRRTPLLWRRVSIAATTANSSEASVSRRWDSCCGSLPPLTCLQRRLLRRPRSYSRSCRGRRLRSDGAGDRRRPMKVLASVPIRTSFREGISGLPRARSHKRSCVQVSSEVVFHVRAHQRTQQATPVGPLTQPGRWARWQMRSPVGDRRQQWPAARWRSPRRRPSRRWSQAMSCNLAAPVQKPNSARQAETFASNET